MDLSTIAEMAKQGGKLPSEKLWVLADALAALSVTELHAVAIESGRKEDTLLQYARAAERWPEPDRVEGVSFSAHRTALSWIDPRALLLELKQKYGSPTVKQVRMAMGLEGHPAITHLQKGVDALDGEVPAHELPKIIKQIQEWANGYNVEEDERMEATLHKRFPRDADPEGPTRQYDEHGAPIPTPTPKEEPKKEQGWTPPIRTGDIAGL
jgi:hypothetical protein